MNTLLLAVLLVLCAGILSLGAILLATLLYARRRVRAFESTIRTFISAPDAQTPSPLAQTVDAVAQLVGRAIIAQAKTTFMGIESGAVRSAQAAVKNQALAQFPWLSVLDKLSPGLSKTLVRNPQLLNLAANLINRSPARQGAPAAPAPGNGHNQEPLFKL